MLGAHLFLFAIGTKAFDRPAHEETCLIAAVPQRVARITANHKVARLAHKGAHVADVALNDDVHAFH